MTAEQRALIEAHRMAMFAWLWYCRDYTEGLDKSVWRHYCLGITLALLAELREAGAL